MPSHLLNEDERAERDRLPYPEVLKLGYFAETFGWDYAQYTRQPEWYTNDLMARQVAKNLVEHEVSERLKGTPPDEGESPVTRKMSMKQLRSAYKLDESVPDEAIAELVGRR